MSSLESTLEYIVPDETDTSPKITKQSINYHEKSQSITPISGTNFEIKSSIRFPGKESMNTIWGVFFDRGFQTELQTQLSDKTQFFVLRLFGALNVSGQSQIECEILTLDGVEKVTEKLENLPLEALSEFARLNEAELKAGRIFNDTFWSKLNKIELNSEYSSQFEVGSIHYHKPMPKIERGVKQEFEIGKVRILEFDRNRHCSEIWANARIEPYGHSKFSGGWTYEYLLRPESDMNLNQPLRGDITDALNYSLERSVKWKCNAYINLSCVDRNSLSLVLTKRSAFFGNFSGHDQYLEFIDKPSPPILDHFFWDVSSFMVKRVLKRFMAPSQIPLLQKFTVVQQELYSVPMNPFLMEFIGLPLLIHNGLEPNEVTITVNDENKIVFSLNSEPAKQIMFWTEDLEITHSEGTKCAVILDHPMVLKYDKINNFLCICEFEYTSHFLQTAEIINEIQPMIVDE